MVSEVEEPGRKKFLLALVLGAVLLVGGGYVYWARQAATSVGDVVLFEPLPAQTLKGHLRRNNIAETDKLVTFVGGFENHASWAEKQAATATDLHGRIATLLEAFSEAAAKGRTAPWTRSRPRSTDLLDASAVLGRLTAGSGARLYPLEVALLLRGALRSLGVPAMLAEAYALVGAKAPPDPSGDFGYFIVVVEEEGEKRYFDPTTARELSGLDADAVRPVDDVNAAGAVLNHWARHQLVNEGDAEEALRLLEGAVKLDPRSPAIRSSRADVLLVTGGAQQALQEFEVAAQLRADPPRHINLAAVFLELRQHDRAAREVAAALEATPEYPGAILAMAALTMADGDQDEARGYLERAEALDPDLPQLPLLWAQFYVATHDNDRAVHKADQAVHAQPYDVTTAMGAALVYRIAGRYEKMRVQARRILDLVPPAQRSVYEAILPRRLGPTALEAPDEVLQGTEELDQDGSEDGATALPAADLQLGAGSSLLRGGASSPGTSKAPSLLEDEQRPGGAGGLQLGEPDGFRLGGGDFMLQLGSP